MSTDVTKYSEVPIVNKPPLPDLFSWPDGRRVHTPGEWGTRAVAWRDLIVELEYGGMPPPPARVEVELLCSHFVRRLPGQPDHRTYRLHCLGGERPFSFCVHLFFPRGAHSVPVIVNGDGCWWYVNDDIISRVLAAGCALVIFNRTEMAADVGSKPLEKFQRVGGLYDVYPNRTFGALSAWAWGYHRCVDFLQQLPFIDASRLAITGHSRGGKTTLLAGATDARIAMVNDNASCAGGSPVYRYVGDGGETINIVNVFPYWFGPQFRHYIGCEEKLPFDQHALLAVMAPRPVLLTFAIGDRWSNPEGMVQSWWAASEVYRFLGYPGRLAFHLRPGDHAHSVTDWATLLDFIVLQWSGKPSRVAFNIHPYGHLRPAFDWRAPGGRE